MGGVICHSLEGRPKKVPTQVPETRADVAWLPGSVYIQCSLSWPIWSCPGVLVLWEGAWLEDGQGSPLRGAPNPVAVFAHVSEDPSILLNERDPHQGVYFIIVNF